MRSFAALLVVWLHVCSQCQDGLPDGGGRLSCLVLNQMCFVGVPLFIMISGGLLVRDDNQDVLPFWKKRLARLAIPMLFWTVAYLVLRYFQGDGFSFKNAVFSTLRGVPYYHLWYLYMLPGLYAVTPLSSRLFAHCSFEEKCLWTLFALAIPWLNHLTEMALGTYSWNAGQRLFINLFLPFIGLYLLGAVLVEATEKRTNMGTGVALALGGGILTIAMAFISAKTNPALFYNLSFLNNIAAALLFAGCLLIPMQGRKVFCVLGGATLGVYLLHPLLLWAMMQISVISLAPCLQFCLLLIVLPVLSWLLVLAWKRIPFLKRTV